MRLPFLQVSLEDSRRLGAELSVLDPEHRDPRWWRGFLEDLWGWGLSLDGDNRPTGELNHPSAVQRMCGVLGWSGPQEQLVEMLVTVGAIARTRRKGVRVKGVVERYGRAWDVQKQQGINSRKGAASRWNHAAGIPHRHKETHAPGNAKTETETETEKKKEEEPAGEKLPAPVDLAVARLRRLETAMVGDYENIRRARYKHGGAKDTKALKALMGIATDDDIRRWWIYSLEATGWLSCSSFAQLALKWNDLLAPVKSRYDPNQGIIR